MKIDDNNPKDDRSGETQAAPRSSHCYAGFSGHEKRIPNNCDWITPKGIIDALGLFDLDPCQSTNQPWPCASRGYTIDDDGLSQPWSGAVWLNPPYGSHAAEWIERLAAHGDGIALVFARTDTKWFQRWCASAEAMLFIRGRLQFYDGRGETYKRYESDGTVNRRNPNGAVATAPSVLVAFGEPCAARLLESGIEGIRVVPA